MDTSEYEALLDNAFGGPVMDHDSTPSFGTPLTCASLCLRMINKVRWSGRGGQDEVLMGSYNTY